MKAFAKKYSNEKQDFHVAAFSSRPVLQVREKGVEQKPMMFTFIDAVARYGRGMVEGDFKRPTEELAGPFRASYNKTLSCLWKRGVELKWPSEMIPPPPLGKDRERRKEKQNFREGGQEGVEELRGGKIWMC
jgi:hypothetical protein